MMNLEEAGGVVQNAAHVVEFELGDEVCAIDIDAVDSIVESKQVTRVPRAPDAVEGVMDLRGETTAIVDPREFLAIGGDLASDNILVLDRADDKQKIGLRVAEVTEVSGYPEAQVDRGDAVERIGTSAVERDLVKGVIRKLPEGVDEDEAVEDAAVDLVLWLDIERLVDAVGDGGDNQR
ncbi:chemotaxis protein CheW [Halobacterium yunchengense]|uniref:chemotaxis protein CheW n=1 Tax=Halobacterium yunchengense TaxID=3108497 RepID=UPI00300A5B0E